MNKVLVIANGLLKKLLVGMLLLFRHFKLISEPDRIFILGHMRSGSSLLAHILVSNNQIIGYGETNKRYKSPRDFIELEVTMRWKTCRYFSHVDYLLDQVNHLEMTSVEALFEYPNNYFIFLVREPTSAISSIIILADTYYSGMTEDEAVDYYVGRLKYLVHFFRNTEKAKKYLIFYEDLVSCPGKVLGGLSGYLQLDYPLSSSYQTHSFTGKAGDPSDNIHEGEIIQTVSNSMLLSKINYQRAFSAYQQARELVVD